MTLVGEKIRAGFCPLKPQPIEKRNHPIIDTRKSVISTLYRTSINSIVSRSRMARQNAIAARKTLCRRAKLAKPP